MTPVTTWRMRENAERGVARLVDCTRRMMSLSNGFVVALAYGVEDADGHALEERLHAERLHLPRRRFQQHVEQDLQRRVDRVERAHLALQELREDLDVAHLVDHLGAGEELRIHGRARIGELAA